MINFDKYTIIINLNFNGVDVLNQFIRNNSILKLNVSFHEYDNLYFLSIIYDGYDISYLNRNMSKNQIQFLKNVYYNLWYLLKNNIFIEIFI